MNGEWLRKTLAIEVCLMPQNANGDWGVSLFGELVWQGKSKPLAEVEVARLRLKLADVLEPLVSRIEGLKGEMQALRLDAIGHLSEARTRTMSRLKEQLGLDDNESEHRLPEVLDARLKATQER
jgi:hypothetical protein